MVRLITSEKRILYVLPLEQKITKNIPVKIKQFKNINNINNSFLQARVYHAKGTYLQK